MELNNYLKSLKEKIRKLPNDYCKEIIKDYENHFKEGLLAGKTESEIICELGDVNYIAKNIISEYYIEHSGDINQNKNTLKTKRSYVIANIIIGILNLSLIVPFVLSAIVFFISLYIFDFSLFITPVALIANLIEPNLPIHFYIPIFLGNNVIGFKILSVLLCVVIGYYIYKILNSIRAKFFRWAFSYIIKSIKFEVFNIS